MRTISRLPKLQERFAIQLSALHKKLNVKRCEPARESAALRGIIAFAARPQTVPRAASHTIPLSVQMTAFGVASQSVGANLGSDFSPSLDLSSIGPCSKK
jgi:hypothetical protein